MIRRNWPFIVLALILLLVGLALYGLITEKMACDASGGTYMKTFMTYECIYLQRR